MKIQTEQPVPVDDYRRVAAAIELLSRHTIEQPSLEELATAAGLSPGHMQRVFQRWAGVSPKRFLQHLTVEHAKNALRRERSVLDVSIEAGLSGPSRLHDHFVNLEAVTPGEYKGWGEGLDIRYGVHPSPFGYMFLAVTSKGICALHFLDQEDSDTSEERVRGEWPGANISSDQRVTKTYASRIFNGSSVDRPLNLLVRGTNFQVNVWRALLEVPAGLLTTYSAIAHRVENPGATRAVGSAVGANRISWLIPCHRVIRSNGVSGSFRWGSQRKLLMNGWESARRDGFGLCSSS